MKITIINRNYDIAISLILYIYINKSIDSSIINSITTIISNIVTKKIVDNGRNIKKFKTNIE